MVVDMRPKADFLSQDFSQVFFAKDVGGFVEQACQKALNEFEKHKSLQANSPQKPKETKKMVKTTKKEATKRKSVSHEPWWRQLGEDSKQSALRNVYAKNVASGCKMEAKNFASRLYNVFKADKGVAGQVHRDAVEYIRGLEWIGHNSFNSEFFYLQHPKKWVRTASSV